VLFYVSSPSSSEADNTIRALIEGKMIEKGYQKAGMLEAANVNVTYKYSIKQYGEPDYAVWRFRVAVLDVRKGDLADMDLCWEGETYSAGRSTDVALVTPYFIDVLFENYDTTVSKKNFSRHVIYTPRLR
jgi:hypothetical protein